MIACALGQLREKGGFRRLTLLSSYAVAPGCFNFSADKLLTVRLPIAWGSSGLRGCRQQDVPSMNAWCAMV